jgi:hypothetical protein
VAVPFLAEFDCTFNIIAAWSLIFFVDAGVNVDRVHYFCVFGVRQHDPHELAIGANGVDAALVVGCLQHVDPLLGLRHRVIVGFLLSVGALLGSAVPRIFLLHQTNLHLFCCAFVLFLRRNFETFHFGTEATAHFHFLVTGLDVLLVGGIVGARACAGGDHIESRCLEGGAVKRRGGLGLVGSGQVILPRARTALVLVEVAVLFGFPEDKGHLPIVINFISQSPASPL